MYKKRIYDKDAGESPCFGCIDRVLGCHGKCDKYLQYRSRYTQVMNKKAQDKLIDEYQISQVDKAYWNKVKKKNSGLKFSI